MPLSSNPSTEHFAEPVLDHVRRDFVRVHDDESVGGALAGVRSRPLGGRVVYFYVVDRAGRLVGVVPTRRLLLSGPETPIRDIMERRVITLPSSATLLDACEFFLFHRLLALPVVDEEGRIVGVVDVELYTDEISELARHEENEDVFQLIGVRLAQVRQASVPMAVGRRFPWLLVNIAGGLACAVLSGYFEDVLSQVIALALYIPVVLALAESVSIQSLTLTLQAHDVQRFQWGVAFRALRREAGIGLSLGTAAGGVVALAAVLWQQDPLLALSILLGILFSVATAALYGLAVPTTLRALQRDPKLASGPMVLAMTDLTTLFYYFGVAAWLFS